MKKSILISVFTLSLIGFFSCTEIEKTAEDSSTLEGNTIDDKSCVYTCVDDSTKVKWIAFKFTEKKGVGGLFTDFSVNGLKKGKTISEIIQNTSITINVSGTNTNDPQRDQRIINSFFGVMTDTKIISGQVKDVKGDGNGIFSLSMNDNTVELPFTYMFDNQLLTLKTVVDLGLFEGQAAIDSLNKECGPLHAGEDGKSVLWPDVDVEISTYLEKNCD